MYKLDKDTYGTYNEFFGYGIDEQGEQELLEAFIFFSYINVEEKYSKANQELPTGEVMLEEAMERAEELMLQYHRFVRMHSYNVIIDYNKKETEKIKKGLAKELEIVKNRKLQEGNMQIKDNWVDFSRQWVKRYSHYPEDSLFDKQDFIMRNWTEEVIDILCYLESAEKEDRKGYYDLWLRTGIERAKNAIDKDEETMKWVKWIKCNEEEMHYLQKDINQNQKRLEVLKPIAKKVREIRMKNNTVGQQNNNPIIKAMDMHKDVEEKEK